MLKPLTDQNPIWSMNDVGRSFVAETGDMINLLMNALTLLTAGMPYRGPSIYRKGKYTYVNAASGDVNWFEGSEKIY